MVSNESGDAQHEQGGRPTRPPLLAGWRTGAIIAILMATNIATIVVRPPRSHDAPPPPALPYRFISPLRALIGQEHFVTTLEPLRTDLRELLARQPLRASVYIEFLNTGANISLNPDERYWPASLAKVPIAIATMRAVDSKLWSLQTGLTITEADRDSTSSELYRLPPGTTVTVQNALETLLIHSDNTAYRLLLRTLPPGSLAEMMEGVGLDQLFDTDGRISAREYSRLLRTLYTSSYLNEGSSQYLLELMDRSAFNFFLRHEIPDSVPFSHKWGSFPLDHTYSDAGIAYLPDRPYLITVMTQGNATPDERRQVQALMHQISKLTFDFFSQAQRH